MGQRLKVAVLLSGGGTTLHNLLTWSEQGELYADVELVLSSRPGAGGLAIAREAGIRTEVVNAKSYGLSAREGEIIFDWRKMSAEINRILLPEKFDLVCMAGFLSRYYIPDELMGRVINIHPSLIPMFCGQGMYGHRVHEAVVASGVKVTGCTVHFADNDYDNGPIVLQRVCPVYCYDTPEEVAVRVFQEECIAYPTAINLIAEGRVSISSPKRTIIAGDDSIARFSTL